MLNYGKMKARLCRELRITICSKGKKWLIIERRIKFMANIRKVSLS